MAAVVARTDEPDALAQRLGQGSIAAADPAGACALIPDPDAPGRRAQLVVALRQTEAALGPSGPCAAAATSAQRARAALALGLGDGLVVADEHRLALLLAADRPLARDLSTASLAPLDHETAASRQRLTATLAAWLDHQGRTERVAGALDVHPQTVRYRLARLRELFGDALDDPSARRELALALLIADGGVD